jgi:hypothetical protein
MREEKERRNRQDLLRRAALGGRPPPDLLTAVRKKWLGLGLPTASRGFVIATFARGRRMMMDGWDQPAPMWAQIGPGGRAAQEGIPAQAQVAAWARGRAACWAKRCWPNGPARGPSAALGAAGRPSAFGQAARQAGWAARVRRAFGPKYEENEISFYFFPEAILVTCFR